MDFWGGYSVTSDLDLGKKVGNLDFWGGGVFCNFGFGLRKKSWKFGFWGGYSVTSDLDLGKKIGKFLVGGGYSVTSDLDLGKKLEIWGGVFCKGDGKRKKPTLQKNLPDQFGIIPKSPIPSGLPNQC